MSQLLNRKDDDDDRDVNAFLHDLIQACLLGTADKADLARLERLITEDPNVRRLYVMYMEETASLQLIASSDGAISARQMSGAERLLGEESADVAESQRMMAIPVPEVQAGSELGQQIANPTRSRTRRWGSRTGVGFALITVATVIALVVSLDLLPMSGKAHVVSTQRVALLHQESNAILLHNGKKIVCNSGQWLINGRYELERGIVQIAFPWGTEATFEAPAIFELQANDDHKLLLGQMVAKVPSDDTGFTVDTPSVEVIDLGTEFGLMVSKAGDCEVHVFKGEVEARAKRASAPNGRIVTAGHATRFAASATTESSTIDVAYNPHRFSRAWQATNRVREVTGAMRYFYPAPESVVAGDYESGEDIRVFLERQEVTFPKVTAVTLTQPGLYTTFATSCDWIPSGLQFDSYLIHYDPVGDSRTRAAVSAEGSVTFANPIIAVITRGDQLAATDPYCASPTTNYVGINVRGSDDSYRVALRGMVGCWHTELMKSEPVANDRLRLSSDRRTLSIQLSAGNETDQLRVLVAVDDQARNVSWNNLTVASPEPFLGKAFVVGETIQAENFDIGGDGIAYYDATPSSLSSCYRYDSSVEMLRFEEDEEVNYCIALCEKGEWVGYTLEIEQEDLYVVRTSGASGRGNGRAHFEFGEHLKTQSIVIPNTGNGFAFQWIESEPIRLPAGRFFVRIVMDQPNDSGWVGNIDCFRIEPFERRLPSISP